MDSITLKNFRCFREKQTARLAPLTLLVGENSTGKTSFMAMIRALLDSAYSHRMVDFKENPYDLGSFEEIAHHRGARGSQADAFEAGFSGRPTIGKDSSVDYRTYHFEVNFGKKGVAPVPMRRRLALGDTWAEEGFKKGQPHVLQVGTSRGSWERQLSAEISSRSDLDIDENLPISTILMRSISRHSRTEDSNFKPLPGSPKFHSADSALLRELATFRKQFVHFARRPFASAPVRSEPRRTYEPSRPISLPEGYFIPMYFADMFFKNKQQWTVLKKRLEEFGKVAGLFDEISIKPLGKRESEPFQVQVRKFAGTLKGPQRNLIDVGYGVSQVLPVITELLRPDAPSLFLLQQPEVHLHPSAQAALGSLFCQVATN